MAEEYVGIDLHRRRSVIYRMDEQCDKIDSVRVAIASTWPRIPLPRAAAKPACLTENSSKPSGLWCLHARTSPGSHRCPCSRAS